MIGAKVNTKAYKAKGEMKKKQFKGFSFEETLLSHYNNLNRSAKKIAKKYFKENIHAENGFAGLSVEEAIQEFLFEVKASVPFPGPGKDKGKFTFIDLFAGIGGFRMALQNLGGECVFSSEWDKYAQQTYRANYGDIPLGDITKKETKESIPKQFDLLCGGFPCQPFSIAGVTKKNSLGRKHGFDDEKQGNLFFHVEEIIKTHRPKAFFLENVKNLISHDNGNTFKIIKTRLEALHYSFDHKVLDGKHFVPQHRERTIMIGFNKSVFGNEIGFDFSKIKLPEANHKLEDILETNPDAKYTLSAHLWNYLQEYAKKHKAKGNGFGFGLADPNGITRTMSARYYKDGAEILIAQKNKPPRRLTVGEAAKLQGYPEGFLFKKVSMNQGYKQFGNSVVVPLIEAVGTEIIKILKPTIKYKHVK